MKKFIYILLSASIFIAGCGGGGGSSSEGGSSSPSQTSQNSDTIINGKVADGYVKNAKVCADTNKNFKCDEGEPFTYSDENGNYSLLINNLKSILISTGGIDTETKKEAVTMYSLPNYKNITPVTSLAVIWGEDKLLEVYPQLTKEDIQKDPEKDPLLKSIVIEIISNLNSTDMKDYQLIKTQENDENDNLQTTQKDSNETQNIQNTTYESPIIVNEGNNTVPPVLTGEDNTIIPPKIGE